MDNVAITTEKLEDGRIKVSFGAILLGFVIDSLWLEDSPVQTEAHRWFFRGNSFQFWDCFILRGSTAEEVIGKLETLADHDPASLLARFAWFGFCQNEEVASTFCPRSESPSADKLYKTALYHAQFAGACR